MLYNSFKVRSLLIPTKGGNMLDEKQIDIVELRGACKALNDTGLLLDKLRVVGTQKMTLAEQFGTAIEKLAEGGKEEEVPKECKDFYNVLYADEFVDPDGTPGEDKTEPDPPKKDKPKKDKPKKDKPKKDKPKKEGPKLSVFGHRLDTMASTLDDAFAKGASYEAAADAAGCKVGRAKDHLAHLKRDKGLKIREIKDGVFKAVE